MRTIMVAGLLAAMTWTSALAETCQKSGEEAGGRGKVCYYRCSFGETTQNVGAASLCPLTAQASAGGLSQPPARSGGSCFKQGERTTGMSKECIYDCTGTRKVETVGSAQLCPLTTRP